jgi:hypothetical protein
VPADIPSITVRFDREDATRSFRSVVVILEKAFAEFGSTSVKAFEILVNNSLRLTNEAGRHFVTPTITASRADEQTIVLKPTIRFLDAVATLAADVNRLGAEVDVFVTAHGWPILSLRGCTAAIAEPATAENPVAGEVSA